MSDEKFQHNPDDHDDSQTESAAPAKGTLNLNQTPILIFAFVFIALFGALIAALLHNKPSNTGNDNHAIATLQSELDARRAELNRQRVAMGLSPLDGGSEPIGDIADRLKKDADALVLLATRYQEMLAEKDREIAATGLKLLESEKNRNSLYDENYRIRNERDSAMRGMSDADRLRSDLATIKSQRDELSQELAAAKEKMKMMSAGVSQDEYTDLKRRLDETMRAKDFFENRVKQLEGDLTKAKLFASSENELLPAAVELFRSLRKLEGKSDSEITTAYSGLGAQFGANVLMTLNFATGASVINPADDEAIRNLVTNCPDGDLMLVIGYASETGNVDGNRTLSSDRATAAAELITSVKRPGQFTQAVYLGQTDRFSSRIPERNQLVEIWKIRKK